MNDQLTRALNEKAERFAQRHAHDLSVDGVLARAGEIRRGRRMRATMAMAAVVIALAVPVGITVTRQHDDNPNTPVPAPQVDHSAIGLTDLTVGKAPNDGYLHEGRLHRGSIDLRLAQGDAITSLARIDGGYLIALSDEEGNRTASFVGDEGRRLEKTWPLEGEFAVSAGRGVGAFTEPDGTVIAIQDGGSRYSELPSIPAGSGFDTIAVDGESCSGRGEQESCRVFVASNGEKPATWVSVQGETASELINPDALVLTAWGRGDLRAWRTEVTDTGSCSEVTDGLRDQWQTCDNTLLAFSPDGSRVLGTNAYRDGIGDGQLSILDAGTGKVELDLHTVRGAFINRMFWEDDEHVLATVFENGQWAVIRIGLDGDREYALAPVGGSDEVSPAYVTAAR